MAQNSSVSIRNIAAYGDNYLQNIKTIKSYSSWTIKAKQYTI